jgi:hypothetical protein
MAHVYSAVYDFDFRRKAVYALFLNGKHRLQAPSRFTCVRCAAVLAVASRVDRGPDARRAAGSGPLGGLAWGPALNADPAAQAKTWASIRGGSESAAGGRPGPLSAACAGAV